MKPDARELFGRFLDLTPLGTRSHGKVRCIFHKPDRHPSLDVDLDRGLFICRSCGTGGGVKRFTELVGNVGHIAATLRSQTRRSLAGEAHAAALREARAQRWARPGVLALYGSADWTRVQRRMIDRARCAATQAGPAARAWRVLAAAAKRERSILLIDWLLDDLTKLIHNAGQVS